MNRKSFQFIKIFTTSIPAYLIIRCFQIDNRSILLLSLFSFTRNIGVRIAGMSTQEAPKWCASHQCLINSVSIALPSSSHHTRPHTTESTIYAHQQLTKSELQASFIKPRPRKHLEYEKVCVIKSDRYWIEKLLFEIGDEIKKFVSFRLHHPPSTTFMMI